MNAVTPALKHTTKGRMHVAVRAGTNDPANLYRGPYGCGNILPCRSGAQSDRGTITGSVNDSQVKALPKAPILVTNLETGL